MLAASGVTSIQLRDKSAGFSSLQRAGGELLTAARLQDLTLVVDDRADLAWSLGCDGVHLGPDDMPVHSARKLLGPGSLIGFSVRDPDAAPAASSSGADYIGTGALAPSPTAPDYPVTGIDGLRRVAGSAALPVIAVGGIAPGMVGEILSAGASGIAVSSGLFAGENPQTSAELYRKAINNHKSSQEVD
jgi:thiamine-phosphate pyrophosphorylase